MQQEYKIPDGEDIFSTILNLYGSLELYGQYVQDNISGFGVLVVTGITGDPFILNISGNYVYEFNGVFIYNNTEYTIETIIFDGVNTKITTPLSGPELPYGPGPATIQISTANPVVQPSVSVYDPSLFVSEPLDVSASDIIPSTINTLKAVDGQNLFDVCSMTYGDMGSIYKLLQDSGIDSINVTEIAQTIFTYDTDFITDKTMYNNFQARNTVINTGSTVPTFDLLQEDGFYLLQEDGSRIIL